MKPKTAVRWRYCLLSLIIVSSALVAAGVARRGLDPTTVASFSQRGCSPSTRLAADSSTTTLLGVNATSPSQLAKDTAEFGHMPILRVYYTGMPDPNAWTTGVQAINKSAVVLSFRVPPATILSGQDDTALKHFFDTAPTGHPIYYSYYHEPEPFITSRQFTLAQYKAAWTHIVELADTAHNPYLKSTLILMSWDLDPRSGINFRDFLPAGHVISTLAWDAYPAGTVHDQNPQPTAPADFMGNAEAASKSVGLPYGFAEFALGTQTDRPGWLAEVASYLERSGALFGTLFDSTGFPWMELTDTPSIQAWRRAVAGSSSGGSPPPPVSSPSPTPSPAPSPSFSPSAPSSPAPSRSHSRRTTPAPKPVRIPVTGRAPLGITGPIVHPATFSPTGANRVRIQFRLSQAARTAICVLNSQGSVVAQLAGQYRPAGWSTSWYFGRGGLDRLLSAGTYTVLVVASNAIGRATARAKLTIARRQAWRPVKAR